VYNVLQHFKKVSIVGGFTEDIMSIDFGGTNPRVMMVSDWSLLISYVDISVDG
jgi:hypothetical protein